MLRRRLGGDADNAADLAHDTFERIIRAGSVDGVREPRAYLTTVATRLTANFYRRLALERSYLQALEQYPAAQQPSEEERALVVEALESISRVLAGLPRRARSVFLLAQLDGLPYQQIADELGISLNVVQKDMIKAITHCYDAVYA
ncbi:sigma-70 family RNA polymerase sigma factor [Pigmentiphaga aceris]|uniref:sigma-70 family RNA polymerase sigma factor n=1 Tax=Pigmentiphaga aceris TaxID=1940612 RepID=UPI00319E8E04